MADDERRGMKPFLCGLVMTLMGVVTAAAALTLVLLIERYTASLGTVVRPHGYLLFFVLPGPAILLSLLACCGYYVGARISHYRPGIVVLCNMVLFAAMLFVTLHWLEYVFVFRDLGIVGPNVRFGDFFYKSLLESDLELWTKGGRGGRNVELGWAGAGLSLLLLGGYLFGAYVIFFVTRAAPYCGACGQFMTNRARQVRYPADRRAIRTTAAYMRTLREAFDDDVLAAMMAHHAGQARKRRLKEHRWRSILRHKECAGCGADCLEQQAYRLGRGGAWTTEGDTLQVYPPRQVVLEP